MAVSAPHRVARVESGVWAGHEEAVRKGGAGPLKAARLGRKVGAKQKALTACVHSLSSSQRPGPRAVPCAGLNTLGDV